MLKPIKVKITEVVVNDKLPHAAVLMQDYVIGQETTFFTQQKGLKLKGLFTKPFYDNHGKALGYIVGTVTELIQQEENDYRF